MKLVVASLALAEAHVARPCPTKTQHARLSTTNHAEQIVGGHFRAGTVRDFVIRVEIFVTAVKRSTNDEKDDVASKQLLPQFHSCNSSRYRAYK